MKIQNLNSLFIMRFGLSCVLAGTLSFSAVNAEELDDIVHAKKESRNFLNSSYSFANVSINYLDWTSGTTDRDPYKKDFPYLEVEGGVGWDWGDFYFFSDIRGMSLRNLSFCFNSLPIRM